MKTRLKRLNYTPRKARKYGVSTRYQRHSESINIDKLLLNNRVAIMDTDKYGNLIADPSNPLHRKWMEE